MDNKTIIIKAENLSYSYPGQQNAIISNLNFTIKKGERIAITGKSGIGKSTLLKLFAGLLHNFSGTIVNNSLCQGYMFQDAYLYPWLNIYDNVALGLRILKKPLQRKRIMEMLEWAGIEDFAFQPPGSLSGGQRQRAALVRTLITKPDIIMLDEAFSSLDSETTKQLQADIIEYSEKNSIALLLVTHNYNEAFHMANEVVYLQRQIVAGEEQTVLQNVTQKLEQSPEQSPTQSKSEYKIYTQTNHDGKNIEIPFFSPKNKLAQLQNTGC